MDTVGSARALPSGCSLRAVLEPPLRDDIMSLAWLRALTHGELTADEAFDGADRLLLSWLRALVNERLLHDDGVDRPLPPPNCHSGRCSAGTDFGLGAPPVERTLRLDRSLD